MNLKSFSEALKGKQHKLDADKDGKIEAEDLAKLRGEDDGSVDRVARSDYKVSASGRKTHKQITFREDQEVSEEKMTDAEMKKREDYVKGMKKNLSSFKDKYGSRAKEVMYATATKMAMKEDTDLEEGYIVKYHAADGEHKNSSKVFNDKAKAEKHAALGNSINKVGGKYTVHKIDSEGRAVKEETETEEKHEMAQTQLHFIKYAAEEILEYIDMGGEIEEWYQNKLSKVQSDLESLHSYIEGEKRRTGMVDEEVEQIDELSKGTLASYAKKATNDSRIKMGIGKDFERQALTSRKPGYKAAAKDLEDKYKTNARKREAGVGKAIDRLAKEEVEIKEQAPVAPTLDRKYIKGTPEHKAYKATKKPINGHPTNVKEELNSEGTDMAEKITFGDFIAKMNEQLLEYESDESGVYRHTKKATYGTSYQGDDDEDEKKPKQPAEKRGRGRPAGAKSGARKITGTSKLYK